MARRSIVIDGFNHGPLPIPAASRVGNVVMTGGVYGLDPETGKIPDGVEDQVRLVFLQLGRILAAAGTGFDDVVRMTFYVKSADLRAAVNPQWVAAFPDPGSRPARHTLVYEHLAANLLIQCDATAVVKD
jgi:2-iminobutanoate/2-iminopropanoate deaminase